MLSKVVNETITSREKGKEKQVERNERYLESSEEEGDSRDMGDRNIIRKET